MAANNMVQCINCKYATYMQWFKNPVIAECKILKERQVAEAKRICKEFKERLEPGNITHFDNYGK